MIASHDHFKSAFGNCFSQITPLCYSGRYNGSEVQYSLENQCGGVRRIIVHHPISDLENQASLSKFWDLIRPHNTQNYQFTDRCFDAVKEQRQDHFDIQSVRITVTGSNSELIVIADSLA